MQITLQPPVLPRTALGDKNQLVRLAGIPQHDKSYNRIAVLSRRTEDGTSYGTWVFMGWSYGMRNISWAEWMLVFLAMRGELSKNLPVYYYATEAEDERSTNDYEKENETNYQKGDPTDRYRSARDRAAL